MARSRTIRPSTSSEPIESDAEWRRNLGPPIGEFLRREVRAKQSATYTPKYGQAYAPSWVDGDHHITRGGRPRKLPTAAGAR